MDLNQLCVEGLLILPNFVSSYNCNVYQVFPRFKHLLRETVRKDPLHTMQTQISGHFPWISHDFRSIFPYGVQAPWGQLQVGPVVLRIGPGFCNRPGDPGAARRALGVCLAQSLVSPFGETNGNICQVETSYEIFVSKKLNHLK